MQKQTVVARIDKLKQEINHHRYLYHVLDRQEISDAALDSLKKELHDLEGQYPDLITPDSPTQRVGGKPLEEFAEVKHASRMLSLEDVFSREELKAWQERNVKIVAGDYEYFVELKIDGVAISLIYEEGMLAHAATRGDGFTGEDVTANIRTIESIPLSLSEVSMKRSKHEATVEVRGEVYMLKKDFNKLNNERKRRGEKLYANPRNFSAGSIRQLDPKLAAARPLRFFAWEITSGVDVETRVQEYQLLQELGFAVPPGAELFTNFKDVNNFLQELEKKRDKKPFLVDGVVLKTNNLGLSQRLGIIGKAPRGSVAYKFAAEEATTIVEDIIVQVGRTGALTPVAQLKPVVVAGTTVSRATLHNADEIKRKDVRIGDTVIIRKAGDIIPEVIRILSGMRPVGSHPFVFPRRCPVCESVVAREEEGIIIRCTNRNCFPAQRERIRHAIGRQGFDIEGLGEKIVEQLLQEGLIKDTVDLWNLTAGDLTPLERFADKKSQKIVTEIQQHKEISLPRFLIALGIPEVGTVTAQEIARHFGSLDKILAADNEELLNIEGIGEKVAPTIINFLHADETKILLKKYKEAGIKVLREKNNGPLAGKTFVFTGALIDLTREEAKARVLARGGKVASTVGKGVDYVVVGADAGSKARKAKDLGLKTIVLEQFKKMVAQ